MGNLLERAGELAECRDVDVVLTDDQGHETWDLPKAQNADVGFRGQRVPADHALLKLYNRSLCSLHIHDATIEISSYPVPIVASHRCSTIRLSKIRFIVNSSVEKHLHGPGEHGDLHHLFVAHGHKSTLLLEDCELETTFDCPSLSRLVACTAAQGGKVTMGNCKFSGFRRVLVVDPGSQAHFKDFVVDVTIPGSYGGAGMHNLVIAGRGDGSLLHMTNCQLSISCARICSEPPHGFLHIEDGCKAELERVTFVGHSDLAATKDAPAISMALYHAALKAFSKAHVQMRGCTFVGGELLAYGHGTRLALDNCHISGSFLGTACIRLSSGGSGSLRRCTVQNLCRDMSMAQAMHIALSLREFDGEVGRVNLEDCLLETMTGCCTFVATGGEVSLTRCSVGTHGGTPASVMHPLRAGTMRLSGATKATLLHCYLEAGLNQPATLVRDQAQLTCKDSLLVGWGGATDQDIDSASIVYVSDQGAAASFEGCTLQYHPDSQHMPLVLTGQGCTTSSPDTPLPSSLVVTEQHGRVDMSQCQLVGPAGGASESAAPTGFGVRAGTHATITLNKCLLFQLLTAWIMKRDGNSLVKLMRCNVHRGARHLRSEPSVKVVKCSNCNGCQECKQPVSLVIPEGTGGSGCSGEVAAEAEALRGAALSKASSSKPSTSEAQQAGGVGASDGTSAAPDSASSSTTAPANSALVECAVCHRKPGDPGVPATLKLCGGCKMARYCSKECQRKDWEMGHKAVCKTFQRAEKF